jgi:Flp pilus assembly protein CpaB
MSYRTRNIVLASGLAALALVFMIVYASKNKSGGATDIAKGLESVLFAAHDIPQGTPGSTLDKNAFLKKRVPSDAVVPGSITSRRQIAGTVATQETLAGEPVTTRRFGPVAAAGVLAQIRGSQRVLQLAGDKNQILDGTLNASDHVDVYATWNVPESCTTCHVSGVIVRNALVLATSSELGSAGTPGTTNEVPVQLRLTNAEAERVLWMAKNGDWWLVLRPVVKPSNVRGFVNSGSILKSTRNQSGIIR